MADAGQENLKNIVQGISRDILCHALMNLSDLDIVAHVHDEIILEAPPELTCNLEMLLKARKPCRMNDIAYRIRARKDFWGLVVNGTGPSLSRYFKKAIKKYCCAWNMPIKKLL